MTSNDSVLAGQRAAQERPRQALERATTSASATRPGAAAATCAPSTTRDLLPPVRHLRQGARAAIGRRSSRAAARRRAHAVTDVLTKNVQRDMDAHLACTTTRCRPVTGRRRAPPPAFPKPSGSRRSRRTLKIDEIHHRHRDDHGQVRSAEQAWRSTSTSGAPGTTRSRAREPGFLYQQNTLRDALVAALNFNIFHRHADRVQMANIAQMVNVLQA